MEATRTSKFMQSLGDSAYTKLRKIADDRDITVQELIRAIVIPDWLKTAEKHSGYPEAKGKTITKGGRERVSRKRQRDWPSHFELRESNDMMHIRRESWSDSPFSPASDTNSGRFSTITSTRSLSGISPRSVR